MSAPGIGHNSRRFLFTAPIQELDPREAEYTAILEDDAAFEEWASKNCGEHLGYGRYAVAPIVRASTYGNDVKQDQELGNYASIYSGWYGHNGTFFKDHRRPVVMRGARRYLVAKYSFTESHIANGYAELVAARYLRRIKYTCSDRKTNSRNMDELASALRRRFHCSYTFDLRGRGRCGRPGFHVGPLFLESPEFEVGEWVAGRHIVQTFERAPEPKPIRVERPERALTRTVRRKTSYRTTRTDERAILRAVYELGLIKEGDLL